MEEINDTHTCSLKEKTATAKTWWGELVMSGAGGLPPIGSHR